MIKKFIKKLIERRKRNIEFKKEFKKKTGVDLNDVHIHGDGPPGQIYLPIQKVTVFVKPC